MNDAQITNFGFSRLGLSETIDLLEGWSCEDTAPPAAKTLALVNPHSLEVARRDEVFADAIRSADLVSPDGVGIILASRILDAGIPEKVCGPDLFTQFCERMNQSKKPLRMFFLGSSDENLSVLEARFRERYPNLIFAGSYSPPYKPTFSDEDNRGMVDRINAAGTDVLWLGLGAPKQEKWAEANRNQLKVKVIAPIGAVFDFFTGRVKLPPKWAHDLGLTFAYRFCQQPRRLLRRNLDSPIFLARVFAQRLRGK
jgi:N-acetylglucosaminyldiphosphoundecaprenol N-acetyl-beta-D-mannosaminyltransferase